MAMIAGVGFTVFFPRFRGHGGTRRQAIVHPMNSRGARGVGTGSRQAMSGEPTGGGQGRKQHQRDQALAHETSQAGCEHTGHGQSIHDDAGGCQSLAAAPITGGEDIPA